MYTFYIFVILKITPYSITNRIKCCTKIQTEQVLLFMSYSHDEVFLLSIIAYLKIFPIYYSNGCYTNHFANNHLH